MIAGDVDAVLTALELATIDYAIERTIRALIAKEDFDGALSALEDGEKNSKNKNKTNSSIANGWSGVNNSGGNYGRGGDNNDKKLGIPIKNDYTNKPKQKVNSSDRGDIVRTPDSHPNDFVKLKNGDQRNKYTKESWRESDTRHTGKQGEWKVGIGRNEPTKNKKITIDKQSGKLLKK